MKYRAAILLLAAAAAPASAQTVTGTAKVVDGDSLEIAGKRIRLFGIDAPEYTQTCTRDGKPWKCGEEAARQMRMAIGDGQVTCSGNEVDEYGRLLAICTVAGEELNRYAVAQGWATAYRRYSSNYVADEARARAAKLGLWTSNFTSPEDYRHNAEQPTMVRTQRPRVPTRQVARTAASNGCAIKGNQGSNGWIYHLPGQSSYGPTRAEQMFCSEADAMAAGYRKSKAP